MSKRRRALREALTTPMETFSEWALAAALIVIAMGVVGWSFGGFRIVAVVGAAGILGAAVGTAYRAGKRRSGRPRPS